MAEVAENRAVGLVHGHAHPLAQVPIGLQEIDCDAAFEVPGDHGLVGSRIDLDAVQTSVCEDVERQTALAFGSAFNGQT